MSLKQSLRAIEVNILLQQIAQSDSEFAQRASELYNPTEVENWHPIICKRNGVPLCDMYTIDVFVERVIDGEFNDYDYGISLINLDRGLEFNIDFSAWGSVWDIVNEPELLSKLTYSVTHIGVYK